MTTSHITSLSTSLPYTEFRPYIPNPKPKPRPMAKSKAKIKTAGSNFSKSDSREGGDWCDIDDFPMSNSHTSFPLDLEAPDPFKDIHPEMANDLHAVHFPQEPEGYQRTLELLDEGEADRAAPLPDVNVGMDVSLPGTSLDCPLVVEEDNPADNCRSRALDHDGWGYHTTARLRECSSMQHGDVDAAGVEIISTEDREYIQGGKCSKRDGVFILDFFEEILPEIDDKRPEDFGVANGPSTRKRAHTTSPDATTSVEMADCGSEPELDDSPVAKRRRECLILDLLSPPESALPTPSNEPCTSLSDSNRRGDAAGTSDLHLADFIEGNGGSGSGSGSGIHASEVGEPLLQLPSQLNSPLATVDEPRIEPDSGRRQGTSSSDDSEGVDASYEVDVSRLELASRRQSTAPSQQPKLSRRPLLKRGHDLSQNTSRALHRRTTQTNSLRRVPSSEPYQLSRTGALKVTRSGCQQASVRIRAKEKPSTNHGPDVNMSYQIADVTLHPVPKGSSIVTAMVRCSESKLMPNLAALSLGILGDKSRAIRTIQVSPDSWLLLGYRYNDDTPGLATRGGLTGLEEGQKSYPRIDSANSDSNHVDNSTSGSEEDEDEEGEMRFRKRTNVPWLELDDLQLKAYVGMDMGWADICKQFPGRTPGAVRTHWHTLQKKR